MFFRLVLRSLWIRKEKFLIAVIAIMLASAMVASLLTISFDIKEKMGKELRSYGANLIVMPKDDNITRFNASHNSIIGSVPFLYFKAEINGKRIELAGTNFEAAIKMNPWWHVEGELPDKGEVLLGINAAKKLGIKAGDSLSIKESNFRASGILDTGTSDDERIFMNFEDAEQISGKNGVTMVKLSVLNTDEVIKYFESGNYEVKKIRQVAESEKSLLDKTRLLMLLVALFVLSASLLGLLSTMITSVLERSKEIGLMKALGCSNRRLASIFLAEAGAIGVMGGVLGYFVGLLIAQSIALEVFRLAISIKSEVLFLTLFISLLIALAGSMLPVRKALSIDPIVTLRGE